jgi:hypothetical protein
MVFTNDAPRMAAAMDNLLNGAVFDPATELMGNVTGTNASGADEASAQLERGGANNSGWIGLVGGALAGLASLSQEWQQVGNENSAQLDVASIGDMSRSASQGIAA